MNAKYMPLPGAVAIADREIASLAPHQLEYDGAVYTVTPGRALIAGVATDDIRGGEQIAIVVFSPPETVDDDGWALSFVLSTESARGYAAALLALADRLEKAASELATAAIARASGR